MEDWDSPTGYSDTAGTYVPVPVPTFNPPSNDSAWNDSWSQSSGSDAWNTSDSNSKHGRFGGDNRRGRGRGRFPNDRRQDGFNDRRQNGFNDRRQDGFNDRRQDGFNDRRQDGFNDRRQDGFNNRRQDGFNNRHQDGFNNRRQDGFNNRHQDGFNDRRQDGFNDRRQDGYNDRRQNSDSSNNWRQNGDSFGEQRQNGFRRSDNNWRNETPAKTLLIPSRMVGKVIGRGGSTIFEYQTISGAKINVTKETQDDCTIVNLHGDQEQVDKAEKLILETIEERPPRNLQVEVEPQLQTIQSDEVDYESMQSEWAESERKYEEAQKARWEKVGPIVKKFYDEKPEVANMPPDEVAAFRESKNNIVVNRTFEKENQTPIPNPVVTFEQAFHNYPEVLDEIAKAGFTEPSPIQCQAWPILLSGEDMIGIAQTGTGKTLAFLLPALIHIDGQSRPKEERNGPAALVFAPTRELAMQIERECKKYYYKGLKAVCIYGGGSRKEQIEALEDGVDIVIATPGRFNDLYMAKKLPLEYVTYVVLDEADRMLDMGFEPQIRKVMYAIRPDRQTVMTSATWPNCVRDLAKSYMDNPIQVYVGSLDLAATHTVTQTILMLEDEEDKFRHFVEFVQGLKPEEKVICFTSKKLKADQLSSELMMMNIFGATLHGNMDQCDREQSLIDIGNGTVQVLIATDLASRGLDIDDITHVVNYDFPKNIEEYVHRVGRTGRAGRNGDSISYFTRADWGSAKELIPILEEADQYVPPELHKMAERFEARRRQDGDRPGGRRGGGRFGGGGGGGSRGGGGGRRW